MGPAGRFAPSPTGPLHFGSLVAALASFADARSRGGRWLVRIEDLDEPRTVPGAADCILRTLSAYGFEWDGEVVYQTRRLGLYREAFSRLRDLGHAYPHALSRQGIPYTDGHACSWRFRVPPGPVAFTDRMLGPQRIDSESDFVLLRADGVFAYQLAVVVDDADQGITDVVRGADLLDSTARQILLQRALALPAPTYLHVPLALNSQGEKLSKQTKAPALDDRVPLPALHAAWRFLGQQPFEAGTLQEFWSSAVRRWLVAGGGSGAQGS